MSIADLLLAAREPTGARLTGILTRLIGLAALLGLAVAPAYLILFTGTLKAVEQDLAVGAMPEPEDMPAPALGLAPAADSSLMGDWKFDEGSGAIAHDASGNGNHGTLFGNSDWMNPGAPTGSANPYALSVYGTADYAEAPGHATLNPADEFTMMAWVYLLYPGQAQKILGRVPSGLGRGYLLGVQNGQLDPEIWDSAGTHYRFQAGAIAANFWTHLAVTWKSGGQMIGYIDGSPVYTTAASANPIGSSTVSLTLGVAPWDHNAFGVNGAIDQVRLYSRTLSVDEIRTAASSCAATPNNGGNIYLTVQQAIDAANPRGTVKLAGTCAGVPSRLDMAQTASITKPLTLSGGYTASFVEPPDPVAHPTVLDAQGQGRVITASADVSLLGLTIQNGSSAGSGAGVYASASVTLANVTLISNTAGLYGGGLYVMGNATLSGTLIVSNTAAAYGGGLYQSDLSKRVSVIGGWFERNVATQYSGGGLYIGGSIVLTRASLINNMAGWSGGGLYAYNPLTLTDMSVVGNFAGVSGSGLYVYGGGGNTRVANAVFARNHTGNNSGAALHFFNSDGLGGRATVVHTTISSPTQDSGVAIYVPAGMANITNTIIASYTTGLGGVIGITVTSDYNLFFKAPTSLITGTHSITNVDPAFLNPAGDDYHPVTGSPAIDHGADVGVTSDLDGTRRPLGDGFDMGAFEAASCRARVGGGPTIHTTLQDAVDAANPGDMVKVSGTCSGVQSRAGMSQTVYLTKPLMLSGGYSALFTEPPDPMGSPAVLDAQGQGRVITASADVSLSGLTIRNGNTAGNGGGIYVGASALLTHVTVLSNTAGQSGGGLYQSGSSGRVVATSSRFERNVAVGALPNGKGGGVYAEGSVALWGTQVISNAAQVDGGGVYQLSQTGRVDVTNSVFERNAARGYSGGGLYAAGRAALTGTQALNNTTATQGGGLTLMNGGTLSDTQVVSNTATGDGGGLFIWFSSGSLDVRGGSLERNVSAAGKGGGVCAAGAITLTGVTVTGNLAAQSGGGLWVRDSAKLTATRLAGNTAGQHGGGLYVQGMGADTRVVNGLFDRNRAGSGQGAALYLFDPGSSGGTALILHTTIASPTLGAGASLYTAKGTVGITNTIIASYTVSVERAGGAVYQDYNLFYPTSALSGTISGGAHSLAAAPAFLNPSGGDYHSTPVSWSVDRGVDLGVPVDLDGNPRPRFGAPDMGAYELQIPLAADLSITKTAHAASVASGAEVTYTLHVSDLGPGPADTVRVTDTLPAGLVLRRFSASGWSCAQASGLITCSLSSLPAGSAPEIRLVAAASAASGQIVNSAAVGAATGDPGLGNNTGAATITVNPIQISFAESTAVIGESGGYKDILVRLSTSSLNTITVAFTTNDDTAQAGTDYTTTSGVLSFAPGEITRMIRVPIVNDVTNEAVESLWLTLSSPTMAELGSPNQLKLSIADDDPVPQLFFGHSRYSESESGPCTPIDLVLSAPSSQMVSLTFTTRDGTALAYRDYQPVTQTLNFAPGMTRTTTCVSAMSDTIPEPDRTVELIVSNLSNASRPNPFYGLPILLTIVDDDGRQVAFGRAGDQVSETGHRYDALIQLSQPAPVSVTVAYRVTGGSATPGVDFTADMAGTLTFLPGMTQEWITLYILDNSIYQGNATVFLELVGQPTNARLGEPGRLTLTILENDPEPQNDLTATGLEITQAVQDLNNSVRLVEGRRTFVRFHVQAEQDVRAGAALVLQRPNGQTLTLAPVRGTNGRITVRANPDRGQLDDAFLFEIPTDWATGALSMTATVNSDHNPAEWSYANNSRSAAIQFEASFTVRVIPYMLEYKITNWVCNPLCWPVTTSYTPDSADSDTIRDWIYRLYPVSEVEFGARRSLSFAYHPSWDFEATEAAILSKLEREKLLNAATDGDGDWNDRLKIRYYGYWVNPFTGMTSGGMAASIPALVATGLTGQAFERVAAHELGHTYGRHHAEFCGAAANTEGVYPPSYVAYPYADGHISSDDTGPTAFYGFDVLSLSLHGPGTAELMTYCDRPNRWISDFTYEGLLDYLQGNTATSLPRPLGPSGAPADRLLVAGSINLISDTVSLEPLVIIPNANEPPPSGNSGYTVVLRDVAGGELSRNPVAISYGEGGYALFAELVRYETGTVRVEIEGPGGVVKKAVTAGANPPTLTLTMPVFVASPGILDSGVVTVAWEAADPDGDPLTYDVLYSVGDGIGWRSLVSGLVSRTVVISVEQLAATTQGRLAVWATDGIHTAYAASDPFIAPTRPPVAQISQPAPGAVVASNQALRLDGQAANGDGDDLPRSQVRWVSDRDGLLGYGAGLSVSGLSAGVHEIKLIAEDAAGHATWDTRIVTVVENASQLLAPPDKLIVEPAHVRLDQSRQMIQMDLHVNNEHQTTPISWTAKISASWLHASTLTGSTPAVLTLTLLATSRVTETYCTDIIFTSGQAPGVTVTVPVEAVLAPRWTVYLPMIIR